ncbi:MAG: hypothetical protein JOZ07_13915 [Solirubrobacterales bacterium]|nr:hypothetical protein [Solirubrobacterales bacterium]
MSATAIRATQPRPSTIMRRRLLAILALALVACAIFVAAVSASQSGEHVQITRDGTSVVSGYDGGAPLAPPTKP